MLNCKSCNVVISQADADAAATITGAGYETLCEACAVSLRAAECEADELTRRENSLLLLCMAGSHWQPAAIERCRKALGRALITNPLERANVAKVLAERGFDGIGRVQEAQAELNEAAKGDFGLLDCVAGR